MIILILKPMKEWKEAMIIPILKPMKEWKDTMIILILKPMKERKEAMIIPILKLKKVTLNAALWSYIIDIVYRRNTGKNCERVVAICV